MRALAGTDSHLGRSVVAPLFALMLAVSGLWASSAGASRGPKESCSSGGRTRDGLGHRPHSAATVPVAANSGGSGCPGADDTASDGPEPSGTENRYQRPATDPPAGGRPGGSAPAPRSGTTQTYSNPSGRNARASGNGGSEAGGDRSAGSSGAGANGDGAGLQVPPEAVSGQPGSGGGGSGASSGGRKSPRRSPGAGRGSGGGRGSNGGHGSVGAGSGGTHTRPGGGYGPAPGGSAGGLPGFRVAPANPPGSRTRSGAGAGGPGMTWSAFRAPGAALPHGMVPPAVVLPSTAAAVLGASSGSTSTVIPAGPIPRTGGEISATAVLSFILILVGGTLRRTARFSRR